MSPRRKFAAAAGPARVPIASSGRRAFRRTGARLHVEALRGSDRAPVLDDVGLRRRPNQFLRLIETIC